MTPTVPCTYCHTPAEAPNDVVRRVCSSCAQRQVARLEYELGEKYTADRCKTARKKMDLTQMQLAYQLPISLGALEKFEREGGHCPPKLQKWLDKVDKQYETPCRYSQPQPPRRGRSSGAA